MRLPTHRQDQLRLARIALDLLTKMPDVDVDGARLPVVGPAAQALEELAAGEHHARALRQDDEHLELDEGQLRWFSAHLDGPSGYVDAKLAALDELLTFPGQVRRRRAAEERPHAASEFTDRERLRDVVVRAELEPENLVELFPPRSQHDDRDVALTT